MTEKQMIPLASASLWSNPQEQKSDARSLCCVNSPIRLDTITALGLEEQMDVIEHF